MFQGETPIHYALGLKGKEIEVLEREDMKEIKDLLVMCLKLDYRQRPKATEILEMKLFKDMN